MKYKLRQSVRIVNYNRLTESEICYIFRKIPLNSVGIIRDFNLTHNRYRVEFKRCPITYYSSPNYMVELYEENLTDAAFKFPKLIPIEKSER
jgi:hypothetical protein